MHTLKEGLLRNHSLERLGLLNTRLSSEGKGKKTYNDLNTETKTGFTVFVVEHSLKLPSSFKLLES